MERHRGPRDELLGVAAEFRHLKNEHARFDPNTSTRRRLEARMAEREERFLSLLARWVPDQQDRHGWWKHFRHGGDPPEEPRVPEQLLFRGVSETGSLVEVRHRADGSHDVYIDGSLMEHARGRMPVALGTPVAGPPTFGEQELVELFDAPEEALEALREYAGAPAADPPWHHARALLEDGLIDANFGLTARGRRALERGALH